MRSIIAISLLLGTAMAVLAQTFQPSDSPDVTVTVQGSGGPVTISDPYSHYQGSTVFWAFENPWSTVPGFFGGPIGPSPVPYSESITVNPDTFPDGTVITFSWPDTFKGAYSYPEVVWGSQFGGYHPSPSGVTITPMQINSIHEFTGTFDVSLTSNPNNYDVLWETYVTSGPNNGLPQVGPDSCNPTPSRCLVAEIGILLHAYPGLVNFVLNQGPNYLYTSPDGSFTATIILQNPGPPHASIGIKFIKDFLDLLRRKPLQNPGPPHAFIGIVPTSVVNGGDLLSGTIDLLDILKSIRDHGYITGNEFLDGWELGIETTKDTGSMTINHLSYTLN